jgi:hypothetical protein
MGTIRTHEGSNLDPVNDRIKSGRRVGLSADRVDAGVGATSACEFLYAVVNVLVLEIDNRGAGLPRHCHALGHGVDRDYALRIKQEGAADGELADRTAAPDRDCLAAF